MSNIRSIFVQANFNTKKGFFGGDKSTDMIDGEQLNDDLQIVLEALNNDGYSIVSVTPITSGKDNYRNGVGYGYGYSYTEGLIVVAKKN